MTTTIRIGISTCPNDTFAFHGLLTGKVRVPDVQLDFELLDVQELNTRLLANRFDVAKASFYASLLLSERYGVYRSGSALGYGVGPLLLAAKAQHVPAVNSPEQPPQRVLCPGAHTTAYLLYQLFYPQCGKVEQTVFSDIMPRLQRQTADFGVCIHEGRFTWQQEGLACVADLGKLWEQQTGQPLPLGGILGRLDLPTDIHRRIQNAIAESISYGLAHREEALDSMRRYAQEFSDEVLFSHVDLYVNQWTQNLGIEGETALKTLHDQAVITGAIPSTHPPLTILP